MTASVQPSVDIGLSVVLCATPRIVRSHLHKATAWTRVGDDFGSEAVPWDPFATVQLEDR